MGNCLSSDSKAERPTRSAGAGAPPAQTTRQSSSRPQESAAAVTQKETPPQSTTSGAALQQAPEAPVTLASPTQPSTTGLGLATEKAASQAAEALLSKTGCHPDAGGPDAGARPTMTAGLPAAEQRSTEPPTASSGTTNSPAPATSLSEKSAYVAVAVTKPPPLKPPPPGVAPRGISPPLTANAGPSTVVAVAAGAQGPPTVGEAAA